MADKNLTVLHALINRLRHVHRRAAARLVAVRLLWCAIAAAGALLALDAMFPLPGAARQALAWLTLAVLAVLGAATWWRATRAKLPDHYVVRRFEQGHARLENDLINALEFSRELERPAADREAITAGLMQSAIRRAVSEARPIRDLSPLRPPNLRREGYLLSCSAGLALLALIFFGDVLLAVLPRYFDPRGDHPPYSPTRITVTPAGAQVDYGSQLVVKAKTSRVPAREASLVLEDEQGKEIQRLQMFETESGAFAQTIEEIRQPLRYYVSVPQGRSRRYALSLNKTPRIESVVMRLAAPAYAHKPAQERQLSQPQIKGYARSTARLTFRSNRPLAGGELRQGGRVVKLAPDGDRAVSGELQLLDSGKVTASVTDTEGLVSTVPWEGKVEILPDEKPTVSITSPGMDSFAIPSAKVPIVVEADDDLGFRNLALVRNVNGSKDQRKVLVTSDGSQGFLHAVENLDLAELGARPGDIISYYATATDSNPDAPRTANTPAYQLSIIAFEEYRKLMQQQTTAQDLAQKYEQYLARLERLAKEQEALKKETAALREQMAQAKARDNATSSAMREALNDAQRRQEDLARQTQSLAGDMKRDAANPPIFDIEKKFKEDLKQFSDRLDAAAGQMRSAGSAMDEAGKAGESGKAGAALEKSGQSQQEALNALQQNAEEYKKGIDAASKELARAMNLIGDVEQFKGLYQRQKELARQARLYKDMKNPGLDDRVRMKELAGEQNGIREQLEQLARDLRGHAEEIKAEQPKVAEDGRRIADEIGQRKIPAAMQEAGDRLGEADGPGGHPPAAKALTQMESMISFCESMGGEGGQCEFRLKISMSRRGMSMGQTMEQLRAGMGSNMGRMGAMGQGSDGMYGSATPFGLFGSENQGSPTRESRLVGAKTHAQAEPNAERASLATSIEELSSARDEDKRIQIKGGERVMEEYRNLIEAYFRGMAEEK